MWNIHDVMTGVILRNNNRRGYYFERRRRASSSLSRITDKLHRKRRHRVSAVWPSSVLHLITRRPNTILSYTTMYVCVYIRIFVRTTHHPLSAAFCTFNKTVPPIKVTHVSCFVMFGFYVV